jgi:uncharacterized protein (TIGR01777 family)
VERVLVTGVSGPIGIALRTYLESPGTRVIRLVRGPADGADQISWDPLQPLDPALVSGFDAVIHLAGETVAGRWTEAKKKSIRDSRVQGTTHLAAALAQAQSRPQVFICASATGYYGNRGDEVLTEGSAAGKGFLPEVCLEWEAASRIAADAGIRTVNVRFGLVLSPRGGALEKMILPFNLGLGGRIGDGQQWWSWVHVEDIVGAVHHALQSTSLSGPVNMIAPNSVRCEEFTRVLASVLHRPALLRAPSFLVRLALGKMAATELLLSSARVQPARLQSNGYTFRFPELRAALEDLLG